MTEFESETHRVDMLYKSPIQIVQEQISSIESLTIVKMRDVICLTETQQIIGFVGMQNRLMLKRQNN